MGIVAIGNQSAGRHRRKTEALGRATWCARARARAWARAGRAPLAAPPQAPTAVSRSCKPLAGARRQVRPDLRRFSGPRTLTCPARWRATHGEGPLRSPPHTRSPSIVVAARWCEACRTVELERELAVSPGRPHRYISRTMHMRWPWERTERLYGVRGSEGERAGRERGGSTSGAAAITSACEAGGSRRVRARRRPSAPASR